MHTDHTARPRVGITRVELAVTVGVLLVAAGLVLPRVQAARADAARTQCHDNLRKLGQGCAEFEKTHGGNRRWSCREQALVQRT